jgi:SAM-dependent methyltransferase
VGAVGNPLVRATFEAAAGHFDDPAPRFLWDHGGRRTVELVGVRPGSRVLDLCCGTGASALPAAVLAGPSGRVTAVDIATGALSRGRAKAARLGLRNVDFRVGDLEDPPGGPAAFDVLICAFGLYFARQPDVTLTKLWAAVAPGGALAVTTLGPRALEPAHALLLDAVAEQRPDRDLRGRMLSWERFNTPASLGEVFVAAGLPRHTITVETLRQPVTDDDVWAVVLGSGYRVLLAGMGASEVGRVRAGLGRRLRAEGVHELVWDVLYAVARRN